jgi:hypothetical protein
MADELRIKKTSRVRQPRKAAIRLAVFMLIINPSAINVISSG